MERLTEYEERYYGETSKTRQMCYMGFDGDCKYDTCCGCTILAMYRKLAQLEDLQEQGRLVELPCKVGDAVYETSSIFSILKEPKTQTVKGFSRRINNELVLLCDNGVKIRQSKINRTVFLTEAEAQAALERMEGKK